MRTNLSFAIAGNKGMAAQYGWATTDTGMALSAFFWGYLFSQMIGGQPPNPLFFLACIYWHTLCLSWAPCIVYEYSTARHLPVLGPMHRVRVQHCYSFACQARRKGISTIPFLLTKLTCTWGDTINIGLLSAP